MKFRQRLAGRPALDGRATLGGMENTVTVVNDIRELSPILPDKLGHTTIVKSEDVRVVVLTFPAGM